MKLQAAKIRLCACVIESDDIASGIPTSELDELYSYSSTFCINQIPNASISIPVGGKLEGSSLSPDHKFQEWSQRIQERTGIGIVLEVESENGIEGISAGRYCIFKGYPVSVSTSYGVKQGTLQVTLQHWLSDMTLIPLLNPLSSPDNPANIAVETCFQATTEIASKNVSVPNASTYWSPVWEGGKLIKENSNNLLKGILSIFSLIASTNYKLKPECAGAINEKLYRTVSQTLDHISGENLEFASDLNTSEQILSTAIGVTVTAQAQDSFYSVTMWDKLVATLLPSFCMGLVPLVNQAKVIPAPGTYMSENGSLKVTPDYITQLTINMAKNGMLAGMGLIGRAKIAMQMPHTVPKGHVTCYRYPPKINTKPGVFKVCSLPAWLENYNNTFLNSKIADNMTFASATGGTTASSENTEATKKTEQNETTYDKICKAFVHTAYNAEVTKANSALLIANLDFTRVPGATIKVQLPSTVGGNGTSDEIYGVITTVSHTIAPNTVQASYRINHVRDPILLKQLEADSHGATIFQQGWDCRGSSLAEQIG